MKRKMIYNDKDTPIKNQRITIELIENHYIRYRNSIRKKLREFKSVSIPEYFYELAYCLLTPQSSAVNAFEAVKRLKSMHFYEKGFEPESLLRDRKNYIRFHKRKAKFLLLLRTQFSLIRSKLHEEESAKNLR